MVMKTSLQLKLGQQLTMTPQLQQAIRLLQLSTLDLQQEIQQALENNTMLEATDDDTEPDYALNSDDPSNNDYSLDNEYDPTTAPNGEIKPERELRIESENDRSLDSYANDSGDSTAEDNWSESIPNDLPVDTAWDDIYQGSSSSSGSSSSDDDYDFESRNSAGESLQDHLHWQLN